ncbi:dynein intermediate chain, putative [Eimeria tenella]|uniref:Dynein intermediate chain, putative n=1 Tax=Eimeria tenella TaxID=5802 RepID=U6KN45_EIMTE|nr:dynein intermediate chain, putative [Eimeria tenella]CDJ37717.1 dynein intermediate chain, putative [Eimeria tenella]|eukprot:XP_013228555.1 dynein intermediate chain, putative [Eimeria tenella]
MSASGTTAPLTDEEREELRQRLQQRRQELQRQQQQVRQLQGKASDAVRESVLAYGGPNAASAGEEADISQSVASLLNEVIAAVNVEPTPSRHADSARTGGAVDGQAASAKSAPAVSPKPFTRPGAALDHRGFAFKVAKLDGTETAIQPKSVETFDRAVQASIENTPEVPEGSQDEDSEKGLTAARTLTKALTIKGASPLLPAAEVGKTPTAAENLAEPAPKIFHQLSEADGKRVMATPEFREFFSSSTKLIERMLGEAEVFNPFADYSGTEAGVQEGSVEVVTFLDLYKDTRYSPHRAVTDLRASPTFPELFLAAYGSPSSKYATEQDAEGCVLVWSLAMKQRPEYAFTCQSAVCSALFNKFQPYVIVGGTYSGSIVTWDTRVQSKPVQRTPLSSKGHTSPVYALEMVGTKNAHNLVSVDTDGRLCQWSLQMMGQPAETLDLKRGSRDVCVECVSFAEAEVNDLCLGSEDGCLMTANIHGNKAGVMDVYEAHGGALTSLHFHPGMTEGSRDYSHLLLSSSVDWSIKLWSSKNLAEPLGCFEGSDAYVYDVKWHPTSPAVFASTNGNGTLELWNLANDWATPAFTSPKPDVPLGAHLAKNKVAWSADGRRLATGDAMGNIEMWNVSPQVYQPRAEDSEKFDRHIEGAKPVLEEDVSGESPGQLAFAD